MSRIDDSGYFSSWLTSGIRVHHSRRGRGLLDYTLSKLVHESLHYHQIYPPSQQTSFSQAILGENASHQDTDVLTLQEILESGKVSEQHYTKL